MNSTNKVHLTQYTLYVSLRIEQELMHIQVAINSTSSGGKKKMW